jgi:hypothetical protein
MSFVHRRKSVAPSPPDGDRLPISQYDSIKADRVTEKLHQLSQVDLAHIESRERSHQDRQAVLDKLRYLRGSEPLHRYDALDVSQIAAALAAADSGTLARVRAYERKFRRREGVPTELARVRDVRRSGGEA